MINPQEMIAGVTFDDETLAASLTYNEKLGFVVAPARAALNGLSIVGFGVPMTGEGVPDTSVEVVPLTRFADLPASAKTIDLQGKGVGPRMYNTPQAATGYPGLPNTINAYLFNVDPRQLLDGRAKQGNKVTQVVRHASRIMRSALNDTDSVVESIHRSYGDASVVLLKSPTRAVIRQSQEGEPNPVGVDSEFMLIRNATITLRRVGKYSRKR